MGAFLAVLLPIWTAMFMLIFLSLYDIYSVKRGPIRKIFDMEEQLYTQPPQRTRSFQKQKPEQKPKQRPRPQEQPSVTSPQPLMPQQQPVASPQMSVKPEEPRTGKNEDASTSSGTSETNVNVKVVHIPLD